MNFSSKNIRFILLVVIVPIIVGTLWFRESNHKIKIAHNLSYSSLQTNILRMFTDNVEMETNNEIKFEQNLTEEMRWPGSRLSELSETGASDMSVFLLSAFAPDLSVFSANTLPYLAENFDQSKALWAVNKNSIQEEMDRQNLIPLFIMTCPPQGLFLKKPLKDEKDLSKIKIRVFDKLGFTFVQQMGFTPVYIENKQMTDAIKSGKVDGALGSKTHFYDYNFITFLPYYYELNFMLPRYIVVMNKKVFQELPDEKREAILTNAAFTGSMSWRLAAADEYKKTMIMRNKYEPVPQWFKEKALKVASEIISDWIEIKDAHKKTLKNYETYLKENHIQPPQILKKVSTLYNS